MRAIAIASLKGGVGTSTTTINLGAALATIGRKVLLIDADPKGNTTLGLNICTNESHSLTELLNCDDVRIDDCVQSTYVKGLDIIPWNRSIIEVEEESMLASQDAKEFRLRTELSEIGGYDYILIDCSTRSKILYTNVLTFATELIVPVKLEPLNISTLGPMLDTLKSINQRIGSIVNHRIELLGLLINFYNLWPIISRSSYQTVRKAFGEKIFETKIPINSKIGESQISGKAVFDHSQNCKGAIAFKSFAQEILLSESVGPKAS